jgi:LemA protein
MWIFLGITFLAGAALLVIYNRLVRLRIATENAWADVDVQLKRRHDLIPNLVETVKAYAGHERETLEGVTRARQGAVQAAAADPAHRAAAENALTDALRGLNVRVEAYPQLQASRAFLDLQQALGAVEDHIQNARRYYNATVRELNTGVEQFPAVLVAGPLGFRARQFFQAGAEDRAAPAVAL